jgi:wyosine [tRNA(Phe)-imidazoG37] synthetase (radical SAM superfamily)
LTDARLRKEIQALDLVIPSLDAVSEEVFEKVNRPHASLSAEAHIRGLIAFREAFSGLFWLEIFIVPGLNDTPGELSRIREAIKRIRPDQVHLNTLDRPAAEFWVEPVTRERLREIAGTFEGADIVTEFGTRRRAAGFHEAFETAIISLLRRRPCTAEDLSLSLDIDHRELKKYLNAMLEEGKLVVSELPRGRFYKIKSLTKCQNDA